MGSKTQWALELGATRRGGVGAQESAKATCFEEVELLSNEKQQVTSNSFGLQRHLGQSECGRCRSGQWWAAAEFSQRVGVGSDQCGQSYE